MNPHREELHSEIEDLRQLLSDAQGRLERLERRATRTEQQAAPAVAATAVQPVRTIEAEPTPPPPPKPAPPAGPAPAPPAPRRPRRSLEETLSPRVLAIAGGAVTALGIAFLVSLGVGKGWIGPEVRVIGAGLLSAALAAAALFLQHRGEPRLARILAATSIAGGYSTLIGATVIYDFLPDSIGLAGALAIATAGTGLGLLWKDRAVTGLALGGAIAAPLVLEAPSEAATVIYLVAALCAALAVTSTQRWWELTAAAMVLALPQLLVAAVEHPGSGVPGLAVAWLAIAAATLTPVLSGREKDPAVPLWLWGSASFACVLGGFGALYGNDPWAPIWVFSFAVAHLGVGFGARRLRPDLDALIAFSTLAGFGLAALGAALVLQGPVLVVAWSAKAVLLLVPRRRQSEWRAFGAAALFALAAGHVLIVEAPPMAIVDGLDDSLEAAFALGALVTAAAAAAWFVRPPWRDLPALAGVAVLAYAIPLFTGPTASVALWSGLAIAAIVPTDRLQTPYLALGGWVSLGLAVAVGAIDVAPWAQNVHGHEAWRTIAVASAIAAASTAIAATRSGPERTAALLLAFAAPAYAGFLLLSGPWTTLALCALAVLATRLPHIEDWRRALLAALLIGAALGRTLIVEAAPVGLGSGTDALLEAVLSLVIVAVAALVAGSRFRGRSLPIDTHQIGMTGIAEWTAGTALVYAGSLAVVELVGGQLSTLGIEGVAQPAQVALSAYWALIGVTAVISGLLLSRSSLRHAGLGLLGLALAKIFILDLSSLEASYRAISFIAVGVLLLVAALAYRRLARSGPKRPELKPLELGESEQGWLGPLLGGSVALITALALAGDGSWTIRSASRPDGAGAFAARDA